MLTEIREYTCVKNANLQKDWKQHAAWSIWNSDLKYQTYSSATREQYLTR